jgi:hypothetical protein
MDPLADDVVYQGSQCMSIGVMWYYTESWMSNGVTALIHVHDQLHYPKELHGENGRNVNKWFNE